MTITRRAGAHALRCALAALTLTTTATVLAPAPADADVPGYEIVSVASASSSDPTRRSTAECPGTKELIGTGVNVFPSNAQVMVERIIPNITAEKVTVAARETPTGTSSSWRIDAYAVCADAGSVPDRYLAEDEQTAASTATTSVTAEAFCEEGDRALAAGFDFDGTAGQVRLRAYLAGHYRGLVVGEEQQGGTSAIWSARAIALCAPLPDEDVHWDQATSNATFDDKDSWSPACPPGFRVTGASGSADDWADIVGSMNVYTARPVSYAGGDFAHVSSIEVPPGTTATTTLFSYVVCIDLD